MDTHTYHLFTQLVATAGTSSFFFFNTPKGPGPMGTEAVMRVAE